jgi:hypothetical protein
MCTYGATLAVHVHPQRLGQHGLLRHRDHRDLLGRGVRAGRGQVDRRARLGRARVVLADDLGRGALGQVQLDLVRAVRGRAFVQLRQPFERGEAPVLLAAGEGGEVGRVEGGQALAAGGEHLRVGASGAGTGQRRTVARPGDRHGRCGGRALGLLRL